MPPKTQRRQGCAAIRQPPGLAPRRLPLFEGKRSVRSPSPGEGLEEEKPERQMGISRPETASRALIRERYLSRSKRGKGATEECVHAPQVRTLFCPNPLIRYA